MTKHGAAAMNPTKNADPCHVVGELLRYCKGQLANQSQDKKEPVLTHPFPTQHLYDMSHGPIT